MKAAFHYDLGSPYAYLTAERVDELMPVEVEWCPVLLGGLFQASGRSSWALTDARDAGIAEIERRASERGLAALLWPDPWPGNGLVAMRAAVVAHRLGRGREFALQALRVHFGEGWTLNDPEAVETALARANLDPASVLAAAAEQPAKTELRDRTAEALEHGVTGVPSIVVAGDVFWGDDRLPEAADAARRAQAELSA